MANIKKNNLVSIDSFKWKVPIEDVKVINQNLLDHLVNTTTNIDTGEVVSERNIQQNSLQFQFNNYHIHFQIENRVGLLNVAQKYVVVLINSKLLERDYLKGITKKNILVIYNKIIDCRVFKCSLETFLNGLVTDCDFKKDFFIESIEDFDKLTLKLEQNTLPQRKQKHGANRFFKNSNKGIEWNVRDKSTIAHPFIKIYHKGIEVEYGKNNKFFSEFIVEDTKQIARIEATIRSGADIENTFGVKNELKNLLEIPNKDLLKFIGNSLVSNLGIRLTTPERVKSLISPKDIVLFNLLTGMINNFNYSIDMAIDYAVTNIDNRTNKYRQKTILKELYNKYSKGAIQTNTNAKFNSYFDEIGWT